MNNIKIIGAFVLGGILGLAVGGYVGVKVGSTDPRINTATRANVVEVTETKRPPKPADNEAATGDGANTTAAAAGQGAGAEEYVISPNDESEIMWVGYKSVLGQKISMAGGFANFEGTLSVVDNSPDESYVDVTVDMNSVFSENSILTTVLKGDMFFDVENHPEAKFESAKIEPADDGYLVTGNFTMRGAAKGIQFPAKIERRGDNVYAEAEFKINRKDWNVGYDSYEDALVLEEVVVSFKILAEPAA